PLPSTPHRPGGRAIDPRTISRVPRFGPRLSGTPLPYPYVTNSAAPQGSQPLLGGSIVATFDGTALDARGTYVTVIRDSGKDVAKATVDRARLRGAGKKKKRRSQKAPFLVGGRGSWGPGGAGLFRPG